MSIESIVLVFSLGLLTIISVLLIVGLVYAKLKNVEQERFESLSFNHKNYISTPALKIRNSKYNGPIKTTNYQVVNPNLSKVILSQNFNQNKNIRPTYSSYYEVVNSSPKLFEINKRRYN